MLLSVPAAFNRVGTNEIWKFAFNKRQAVLQEHESLTRTALQASMEISQFKAILEAASNKKLTAAQLSSELLKEGLQQVVGGSKKSKSGEDDDGGSLSANFISQALSVQKSVLGCSRCVELIMELESLFGTHSPFHQMSKLSCIASKPASSQTRQWVLECIHDWVLNDIVKVGDISKGSLSGDKHHCGYIQLCEMKLKVSRFKFNWHSQLGSVVFVSARFRIIFSLTRRTSVKVKLTAVGPRFHHAHLLCSRFPCIKPASVWSFCSLGCLKVPSFCVSMV